MIHYVILTTGSCGNCYAFYDGERTVLVDAGVTFTKLSSQLEAHGIPLSSLDSLFITHLHPDHSKGVGPLMRKTRIRAYISDISHERNQEVMLRQRIKAENLSLYSFGESIDRGSFHITPFRTSHDSEGSAGYFIGHEDGSFFLMTDTGRVPDDAFQYARDADVEFIESNYDDDMLSNGHYTEALKRRIRGLYGHLSNKDAIDFASRTARHGDSVFFIHLSENNNDPEIVRELAFSRISSGIFCKVLARGEMTEGFIG